MTYIGIFLFFAALTVCVLSEKVYYDNVGSGRECKDEGECIIECSQKESCLREIHCHRTYEGKCTIKFMTKNAGSNIVNSWLIGDSGEIKANKLSKVQAATIFTHKATEIHIETYRANENKRTDAKYKGSCRGCTVYAHEQPGAHLYLEINGYRSFEAATVYAPFGKNSYLSIVCTRNGCRGINIFDDGTTTIYMRPKDGGAESFKLGRINNIFDSPESKLYKEGKKREHYTDVIDMNYRGPVHLSNCHGGTTKYQAQNRAWQEFVWRGDGHGDWFITNAGSSAFKNAGIHIGDGGRAPNTQYGHIVRLIGIKPEDTSHLKNSDVKDKKLTEPGTFRKLRLTIYSNDYYFEAQVSDASGLAKAIIDAKQAHSVDINCVDGGGCIQLEVYCPSPECKIFCGWDTDRGDGANWCTSMNIHLNGDFCTADGGQALMCENVKRCIKTKVYSNSGVCQLNGKGECKSGTLPVSIVECKNRINYERLALSEFAECSIPEPPPIGVIGSLTTLPPPQLCLTNEEYYIQFILDESTAMANNFEYIKEFTYNVITRDINEISSVSIISFESIVNYIYSFNSIQVPRSDMLSALMNKQLVGGIPNMYQAVKEGINLFKSQSQTTIENNFMVLIVFNAPKDDFINYKSPCELTALIKANNIQPIVIAVGLDFTETELDCLSDQYYEITGCDEKEVTFDMSQFNPISRDLYNIFCEPPTLEPTTAPTPSDIIKGADCTYYGFGMIPLVKDNAVYKGWAPQKMEFEFDIVINRKCKSAVCNIFEFGSSSEQAASLSINGKSQSFRLSFGCDYNSNPIKEIPALCTDIYDNDRHHIYILFTENELRFDLDWNTLYHEISNEQLCSNTQFQKEYLLYLSSPTDAPLDAIVHDFCFKSGDRNMYYTKIPTRTTRGDAEQSCLQHGFELASIVNEREHTRAWEILKKNNNDAGDGWIGLFGDNNNKIYTWSDGTTCDYAPGNSCNNDIHWEPNQPDGRDPCVQLEYTDGLYSTEECDDTGYPICNDPQQIGLTSHSPTKRPTWEPTPTPTTQIPTTTTTTDYPTPEPTPIPSPLPTFQPSTMFPTSDTQMPTYMPSAAPTMSCDYMDMGPTETKQTLNIGGEYTLNLDNTLKLKFDYEILSNCPATRCNLIQIGIGSSSTLLKINVEAQNKWVIQSTIPSPQTGDRTFAELPLISYDPAPIADGLTHHLEILVNSEGITGLRVKIDNNVLFEDVNYNVYPDLIGDSNAGGIYISDPFYETLKTSLSQICIQSNGEFNAAADASKWLQDVNNNEKPIDDKNSYKNYYYFYFSGFVSGLAVIIITEIFVCLCYYFATKNKGVGYIKPVSQYDDEEQPIVFE